MISLFLSSFHFPPPSHSLLPPTPALVTYFLCFTPKSIFLISSRIDFAISYRWRNPAIRSRYLIQSHPAPSFAFFFLLLYLVLYLSRSAFHCDSLQMGLLCSVLLLGNLRRVVEQCLDWMWLALLSILCCRTGAMHKILCWQPAVYHHHSTDIQHCEDYQSVRMVKVYWCNLLSTNHSAFTSFIKHLNTLYFNSCSAVVKSLNHICLEKPATIFVNSHCFINTCTESQHILQIVILVIQTLPQTELLRQQNNHICRLGRAKEPCPPGTELNCGDFGRVGKITRCTCKSCDAPRRKDISSHKTVLIKKKKKQLWNYDDCILGLQEQHVFFVYLVFWQLYLYQFEPVFVWECVPVPARIFGRYMLRKDFSFWKWKDGK